jgi:hypothetical protein
MEKLLGKFDGVVDIVMGNVPVNPIRDSVTGGLDRRCVNPKRAIGEQL